MSTTDLPRDPLLRLYRRQFVIGPREVQPCDSWIARPLQAGGWLSHCPDLQVQPAADADGNEWVLLGLAVQTEETEHPPAESIRQSRSGDVPSRYPSSAGRVAPPPHHRRGGERMHPAWNEWRTRDRGHCLVLDDAFEHEVRHEEDTRPLVLIVDCWPPDLTAPERDFVVQLHRIWRRG